MNNRRKLVLWTAAFAAFVSWGSTTRAQDEPYQNVPLPKELPKGVSVEDAKRLQGLIDAYRRQDPLTVTKPKGNLYMAKGGSSGNDPNMGFYVGKTSVIIVDSKNVPDSEKAVLAEIAKITSNPIKTVILSHSDNQFGVTALPMGLTIISQENTKKEMEASTARNTVPKEYFPTKTIDKDETVTIDGVRIRMQHWAPAHTSGDLVVSFPSEKVVFCEDLIVTDFPLAGTQIHPNFHGTVAGWLETAKGNGGPQCGYLCSGPW